jgi:hypothetical protein
MTDRSCWTNTLATFLTRSNEDEAYAAMLPVLANELFSRKSLSAGWWLDIGPGPGSKLAAICYACHLDWVKGILAIEPAESWHADGMGERLRRACAASVECVPESFEEFARKRSGDLGSVRLLTCFQVLYHPAGELIAAISAVIESRELHDCCLILSAECDESVLAITRRELRKAGIACPESALGDAVANLSPMVPFTVQRLNKTLLLRPEDLSDPRSWLFPFLLGVSRAKYEALPSETQDCVCSISRSVLDGQGSRSLSIPDDVAVGYLA